LESWLASYIADATLDAEEQAEHRSPPATVGSENTDRGHGHPASGNLSKKLHQAPHVAVLPAHSERSSTQHAIEYVFAVWVDEGEIGVYLAGVSGNEALTGRGI
jgi:hypothetical protein